MLLSMNYSAMSQGDSTSGDYEQHAVGGAFEAGYTQTYANELFVEPYGRLSYVHLNGKTVNLDNGMKGKIKSQDSLIGEVGIYAGKTYHLNGHTVQPYLKAAFVYEFMDNNKTTINDVNTLTNDLSGGQGRYGAGIDAKISQSVNLYGEVNYANGNKVESPVQGNIGIRYTF